MAIRRYRFVTHHAVLRHQLSAALPISDARWNWVVGGNGTFEGYITMPDDDEQISAIRNSTEPLIAAVYVRSIANSSIVWGGPIVGRTWDGARLKITAVEWRTWAFQMVVPPLPNLDMYYSFDDIDQLAIARMLLQLAVGAGTLGVNKTEGGHPLTYTSQTSGKLRDLHVYGTEMKRAGDLIDSMANRDGGFDWTLQSIISPTDGLPLVNFHCYFPEQGNVIEGLMFKATSRGGNCVPGGTEESAASRYSRFWATGSGQAPDQVFASDTDPNLSTGYILRFDGSTSYSTVNNRTTLASHARRARRFYAPGINNITVTHNLQQIDPDSYSIGDRARLIVQDRWHNIDQSQVRIVDKEMSSAGAGSCKVTFDLTDDTLPEVDTGGAV